MQSTKIPMGICQKIEKTQKHYMGMTATLRKINVNWKALCLPQDRGRITLTTIPFCTMLSTKIPTGICQEIEKAPKNFIWGMTLTLRKLTM